MLIPREQFQQGLNTTENKILNFLKEQKPITPRK